MRRLVAAGVALLLVASLVAGLDDTDEAPRAAVEPASTSPLPLTLPSAVQPQPPAPAAPAANDCPHQQMDLSRPGTPAPVERACIAATRTSQTGSVRRYLLDAERPSAWSLAVDTAGGQVVAARLSAERQPLFGCIGAACRGFSISRPDRHGARTLTIADAPLAAGEALVLVRASLQMRPDSQSAALACRGPSLTIVEDDGALTEFCPMGGTGFEVDDAGNFRYVFRDLEGRLLTVELAADGAVLGARFGAFSCRGADCGGIVSASGEPPGGESQARGFEFSGAFLSNAGRKGASATLNGRLVMPAQD